MELFSFSNFEKIANTFTVSDIADSTNIHFYNADDVVGYFDEDSKESGQFILASIWICLVKENEKVIGYYSHKSGYEKVDIDDDGNILNTWKEIIEPISPNSLISGDTPILDLFNLFDRKDDFYLVLNRNEITHSICYYDLDCNEVKISIFALIMEMEKLLNELILKLHISVAENLSVERLKKINENRESDKFKDYRNILYNTNLRDKFKLLQGKMDFGFIDKDDQKAFIQKLSEVRNKIAHGESIIGSNYFVGGEKQEFGSYSITSGKIVEERILYEPPDMEKFIQQLKKLVNSAKQSLLVD